MSQSSEVPEVFYLIVPAAVVPYAITGTIAYTLNHFGLHTLVCWGIFLALSYAVAKSLSFRNHIIFGTVCLAIVIFAACRYFGLDFLWSTFWTAAYAGASYFLLKIMPEDDPDADKIDRWALFKQSLVGEFGSGAESESDEEDEPEARPKVRKSKGQKQPKVMSEPPVQPSEPPRINIQFEISPGAWRTVSTLMMNSPQHVVHSMRNAQKSHTGKRIRAVDENGKLVDML
ncbi:hypothetical protein CMV14_06075 [Rhizorhabdus dicambivorans]|uniref:hypothetical protein n=1 Tax=Rhizorhabdus dicambivorans TaxID=1850238 RepID=UPI00082C0A94|nr:hypothetical protein [Rhizorhabdus dicambivorans]ATE64011.1 hypothetical protein CMV14_06075 [Rhizorhabdus dicambivorans]